MFRTVQSTWYPSEPAKLLVLLLLSTTCVLSCTPSPAPNASHSDSQNLSHPTASPAVSTRSGAFVDAPANNLAETPADTPVVDPLPPPLEHPDPFLFLTVQGHGDAVVSLPLGTRKPRPVVLATHGNYDTPEWQCQVWRDIVQNDAFVLCPRGTARGDSPSRRDLRYHYLSNKHLEKEIDAGLQALRDAYPLYVDDGPLLFTGFSQGAIMGATIMGRQPERYSRAVLIEGGNRAWNNPAAKKFQEGGGERILFACGQWTCQQRSTEAKRALTKFGIETRVVTAKGEGHSYGGGVAVAIADAFDWLIEGDERWNHRRNRNDQTSP